MENQSTNFKNNPLFHRIMRTILWILGSFVVLHTLQDVLHVLGGVDFFWLPFVVYQMAKLAREHRDLDLNGEIPFSKAFGLSFLTGVLASVFSAAYMYIMFRYIMHDQFLNIIDEMKKENTEQTNMMAEVLEKMNTIEGFFLLAQGFVMIFGIAALIVSLVVSWKKRKLG